MKAESRLVLYCLCLFAAVAYPLQTGGDLNARWCEGLVQGRGPAPGAWNAFLQDPALAEASQTASAILPSLVRERALSWPGNPAGEDLDHYPVPGASTEEPGRLWLSLAERVQRALAQAGMPHQLLMSACVTDLDALALLARYHARKAAAAHNLRLFEDSGDARALRRALSSAGAASDIWDRLSLMVMRGPALLFSSPVAEQVGRDTRIARRDLALVTRVNETMRRYGLFDAALEFGPERDDLNALPSRVWPQGRFRALGATMAYTRERGFGWRQTGLIRPAGTGLRGTGDALLTIDLPDGDYRVNATVANQPELASGSFQIRSGTDAITYEPGESGEKSVNARASAGRLEIGFVPGSGGDWLVSTIVITRRAPHFGYLPPRVVGSELSVDVAITAPDGIAEAGLWCGLPGGEPVSLPLVRDGTEFTARLQLPVRWMGKQIGCRLTAIDGRGTEGRFPPSGEFTAMTKDE